MPTNDFYKGILFELEKMGQTAPSIKPQAPQTTPSGTTYTMPHGSSIPNVINPTLNTSTTDNFRINSGNNPTGGLGMAEQGAQRLANNIADNPELHKDVGYTAGIVNQFSRHHPVLTGGRGLGIGYGADKYIQQQEDKIPSVGDVITSGNIPPTKNILGNAARGYLQGDQETLNGVNKRIGDNTEGFAEYNPEKNKLDINFAKGFSTVGKQVMTFIQGNWGKLLAGGGLLAIIIMLMKHQNGNFYGGAQPPQPPQGPRFL